uniref:Uncharacterized protein n=1 Tax=Acrobeloides nanus TaxID=290746 RepID=A0A914D5K5_9BILA
MSLIEVQLQLKPSKTSTTLTERTLSAKLQHTDDMRSSTMASHNQTEEWAMSTSSIEMTVEQLVAGIHTLLLLLLNENSRHPCSIFLYFFHFLELIFNSAVTTTHLLGQFTSGLTIALFEKLFSRKCGDFL